jgi:hypothetical protein
MRTYYDFFLVRGIRRSANRELRQMDRGFYGCKLPHPGVECFIAQLNKFLMNYGCVSGLGMYLQTSMEIMIVEGGVSTQILSQSFQRYSKPVTHSWLRLVWKKVDMLNILVEIRKLLLKFLGNMMAGS